MLSNLTIQGLRFLLTHENVSICTCQKKDSELDQQSIKSRTHYGKESETLQILEFMIPMSVLGLVCERNVPTLENLSMVLSGHLSCQVSQHDLSEILTNQMNLQSIKHRILHAIEPTLVGISSSHVSFFDPICKCTYSKIYLYLGICHSWYLHSYQSNWSQFFSFIWRIYNSSGNSKESRLLG